MSKKPNKMSNQEPVSSIWGDWDVDDPGEETLHDTKSLYPVRLYRFDRPLYTDHVYIETMSSLTPSMTLLLSCLR